MAPFYSLVLMSVVFGAASYAETVRPDPYTIPAPLPQLPPPAERDADPTPQPQPRKSPR